MIEVVDADPPRWPDVATVMGTRGDPARCWCQYFRLRGKQWQDASRESLRDALRAQVVEDPVAPGVLALSDGEPVGWCALAPRAAYLRLAFSEVACAVAAEDGLWSITCFVVRVGYRRQGVATSLLDGALDLARRRGASAVEGYPVDTAVKRASSAELYHGTVALFARAGFIELARPLAHRPVLRLGVAGGRK